MGCALPVNDVPDPRGNGSRPVGNSVPTIDLQPLFRQALEDTGAKHEHVAACMGLRKSHFSEMVSGERPFTLERLEAAPIEVQQAFARRYCEAMGLRVNTPDEQTDAIADALTALGRLTRVLAATVHPRMVKAELR